ncbi:MAG TPA: sigma-54 dependent transcriptional regulator [Rudaea sp.]|nr:sigma-54 dependent transcriptional regulator [Rudaea sp.]
MENAADVAGRILLVDDDKSILRTFRYCLEDSGYMVATAQNGEQARTQAYAAVFDACFLDLNLGDESGLDLLPQLREIAPWMRVVMATAQGDVATAVKAIHAGAADYLVKPCSPEQLRLSAAKQVEARQLELRLKQLEDEKSGPNLDLTTANPAMSAVVQMARHVAETDANILILGESGTGKGMLARAIHHWSARAKAGFVTVACPSLSAELLESELFGHQKGAFTGATESTPGRISQANGGTLFLDEIGDFPLSLQPKLLRFIQDKEYERVGDPVTRKADVRIVTATNRSLEEMVKDKTFREDLYYRLNVISLLVPPLRDRPEDVPVLAETFLAQFVKAYRRPARKFSREAMQQLRRHSWPGNVRELQNVVERASIVCDKAEVDPVHLGIVDAPREHHARIRAGDHVSLSELEQAHITALVSSIDSLDEVARLLGIDVSTLYRKRKQFGI